MKIKINKIHINKKASQSVPKKKRMVQNDTLTIKILKYFKRTYIIIKKTFQDIYSLKKLIFTTILMVLIPILLVIPPILGVDFGAVSVHHAATAIGITLVFWVFFWMLGIAFTSVIGTSGSSLIAEEVSSGTLLILVSKPISRIKIFLGKYIALYIYGMLVSFLSIFILGWASALIQSGNLDHFIALIPFLTALFAYSLFLLFLFTSITMAFSSIFKKSRTTSMIVIIIVMISYLAFFLIRMLTGTFYSVFQLYHFDLGYHLGNVFIFFIESLNAIPPSINWQMNFGMMTGVYETVPNLDPDQYINLGGLEKTNYYLPIFSLLLWVVIAVLLLIFGIFSLKKREISN